LSQQDMGHPGKRYFSSTLKRLSPGAPSLPLKQSGAIRNSRETLEQNETGLSCDRFCGLVEQVWRQRGLAWKSLGTVHRDRRSSWAASVDLIRNFA
jgi:hypothetical protein